jgi:RNA polymerase sigma factor (sigma-70 family)
MQDPPTLKGLRKGEKPESLVDAITALYLAWRIDLWRFATFKNFGPKEDLEDLLHDVFIELYVHVINGSTVENPRAWIYRALLSRGIDRYRRAQRLSKYLMSLPTPPHDNERGVEQNLERVEMLNHALSQLNFREKDILMLRRSGLSYEEIANTLEISVSAVSVYINRGLRKLRNPES